MANYPFKHWYAIVDGGCWYVGYHINREDAKAQAIRTCNVHHSKAGYVVVDRQVLQIIADDINATLAKDKE